MRLEHLETRELLSTFTDVANVGGGKAAWGDYNKDGWVDLCAGGTILRYNGGLSFTNTGWSSGTDGLWGDFDNDGYLDLFGVQHNSFSNKILLQNDAGAAFVNATSKIPFFGTHVSNGAAWADLNSDGYLDLYVGGYEDAGSTYPDRILTYNSASQQFNVTWQETVYRARGVTVADFDRDGDQDVYVSNYRLQPNRLWRNNGTGVMTDVASSYGVAGAAHTIGSAWGDFDNDGYLDLFVGNFSHPGQEPSHFLRNLGPSGGYHFQNMKDLSGGDWQESYYSPALGDYDNDGDLDLFFTTVYAGDNPRLYRNDGNWQFTNVTSSVGLGGLGATSQAAWADVDNDGDLDLATAGKLFINDAHANGNHYLKIRVEGDGTTVNRSAIGTQVRVSAGGQTMTRQVEGGTGEGNQNDLTLHFGLGTYSGSVSLEVFWPDGTTRTLNVTPNQTKVIRFNEAPTTPSNLAATNVLHDRATITWDPSTDPNGDPVTYDVQYRKDDLSDSWSSTINSSSTSVTLTGLERNTAYRVRVRANDGQDTSSWLLETNLFTTGSIGAVIGESGQVTDLTDQPQTILLQRTYVDPVVFAQSASRNGGHPVVVRVTDVQADRFTLYLQEPPNLDGVHNKAETVSYVVLESGEWRLDDGRTLEVGTAERNATVDWLIDPDQWETMTSTADFAQTRSRGK